MFEILGAGWEGPWGGSCPSACAMLAPWESYYPLSVLNLRVTEFPENTRYADSVHDFTRSCTIDFESWYICVKCHFTGFRPVKSSDPEILLSGVSILLHLKV